MLRDDWIEMGNDGEGEKGQRGGNKMRVKGKKVRQGVGTV